jgi:hypothetical protein
MNDGLTFAERYLLYWLIDIGVRYDEDRIEDRVLINRGLAERYANPITGHTMIRVTDAGRALHDSAFPPADRVTPSLPTSDQSFTK